MPDYAKIKQNLDMKVPRQFLCKCVQAEIYVLLTAQTVDLRTETGMIREITLMTGTFRPIPNLLAAITTNYIHFSENSVFPFTIRKRNKE